MASRDYLKNETFYDYQLSVSSKLFKSVVIIVAAFNILLIAPDLINIAQASLRVLIIAYRSAFSLAAALLLIFFKRIKTFKKLSLIVSAYELAAAFIFFHVYDMYPDPDFTIQLLGTFTIIMAVFLVPNMWANMLSLSVLTGAAFLAYSYFRTGLGEQGISPAHFIAAAVYIAVEIALCSIFALNFNRYKQGEFSARAELQRIYATDPLTKIGNRVKLEKEAVKWMEYCKRHGHDLSLVLIDVDNLKQINDEHGHLAGDVVLYEIAQILYKQLRINDVCVRWGGDEFILMLPHTSVDEARELSERIRESIQKHPFSNDTAVTCSFGISDMKGGAGLYELIGDADNLMYRSKKTGKDSVSINA